MNYTSLNSLNGVIVRESAIDGKGVFATRRFEIGKTVIVGQIEKYAVPNSPYATQVGIGRYVIYKDPVPMLNHSCEPNCGVVANQTGAHNFVAIKNIMPGQEITIDYAMTNYSVDYLSTPCSCGSPKCRKYISGWKDLSSEIKKAYLGLVDPYLIEIDSRGSILSNVK
ncbi:MAG: SET domain-containing protein-lysine N-methyltransferase [Oscillatoria sp. SIO1A7]|nr:SET domain-containing protein-lysine N-methyltransferase [Oscillatoria sp. SIO1A7]